MSEYKCAICGNTNTRRKSWAYQGGRVCRTHDLKDEETRVNVPATIIPDIFTSLSNDNKEYWKDKHCWICGCAGIASKSFWEYIINSNKLRPVASAEEALSRASLSSSKILLDLPINRSSDVKRVMTKMKKEVNITNSITACTHCAQQLNHSTSFLVSAKANSHPDLPMLVDNLQFNLKDLEKLIGGNHVN